VRRSGASGRGRSRELQRAGAGRDRGRKAAVEKACEIAKAKGAKRALPLPVSAPFHSSLLKPASDRCATIWRTST
jgi:hypothetical protein